MAARIVNVLLTTILAGCFPVRETFYAPLGDGNARRSGACGDGTSDLWRVDLPGRVGLLMYARDQGDAEVTVTYRLSIPDGHTARFTTPWFELRSSGGMHSHLESFSEVRAPCIGLQGSCLQHLAPEEIMVGASYWQTILLSKRETKRPFTVELSIPRTESFALISPAIEIDGAVVEVPVAHFKRVTQRVSYGLCQ
jgi:hypothetical protein